MRTLQQIIDQMNAEKTAQADLVDLDSPSQTAIYTLWIYIQAMCQYFLESLVSVKQAEIETTVNSAIVPSEAWLQRKALEFQYSATVPQVVQLVDFVPTYNPVDATLRIITRASVQTTGQRIVTVKVAKSEPPVALSGPELSAFQAYLTQGGDGTTSGTGTGIGYAGVQIKATSITSDRLFLRGTIKYNGQYSATVQADVIAAINNYLANIPFDGQFKVLSLIDAIQSVPYVTDIDMDDIAIRANAVAFSAKTYLIQSKTSIYTSYQLFAGYLTEEPTAGETFADKLTFVPA